MIRFLPVLLLAGCVAVSPNFEEHIDPITEEPSYEISIGWTYPRKQFMTSEEWEEYHELPPSQKDMMYKYYRDREEMEQQWDAFLEDCLLELDLDCQRFSVEFGEQSTD